MVDCERGSSGAKELSVGRLVGLGATSCPSRVDLARTLVLESSGNRPEVRFQVEFSLGLNDL